MRDAAVAARTGALCLVALGCIVYLARAPVPEDGPFTMVTQGTGVPVQALRWSSPALPLSTVTQLSIGRARSDVVAPSRTNVHGAELLDGRVRANVASGALEPERLESSLAAKSAKRLKSSLCELRRNKVAAPWIMEMLLCWRAVAHIAGISWVLASGTLLGAIRDGEVISWDGDGDTMIASSEEWRRVYKLYFRNVSVLQKFANILPECSNSSIIFPSSDAYVAARVIYKGHYTQAIDITAPYIGNYSTVTPQIAATFRHFGFDRRFEDTRCVKGCPFFVAASCSSMAAYKSREPESDHVDASCAAFIDHFLGVPTACKLGGHEFMCPQHSREMLVNDYGVGWRTPMYTKFEDGSWY